MGQKDISLVRYFEDEDRYADLINGFIFGGERVVSGADIQELDSRITGFLSKIKDGFKIQKYRDSVRKVVLGLGFAIIGLENQDRVHHAMPIRIMLEDAAGYDKQMRRIQNITGTEKIYRAMNLWAASLSAIRFTQSSPSAFIMVTNLMMERKNSIKSWNTKPCRIN